MKGVQHHQQNQKGIQPRHKFLNQRDEKTSLESQGSKISLNMYQAQHKRYFQKLKSISYITTNFFKETHVGNLTKLVDL